MSGNQDPCGWVAHRLPWYLNGSLAEDEAKRLREHIHECDACRGELEEARWALNLFDAHLPLDLLEGVARGDAIADASANLIQSHLEVCETCSEQVALMSASWEEIEKAPHQRTPGRKGFPGWLQPAIAAILIMALGFGWWSSHQSLKAVTPVQMDGLATPYSNLVTKDLFPVELIRRSNADPILRVFDGFQGVAVTLHSQMPAGSSPFQLEILDNEGVVIWTATDIQSQENGLVALVVPAKLLARGSLVLKLTSHEGAPQEHYQLTTQTKP